MSIDDAFHNSIHHTDQHDDISLFICDFPTRNGQEPTSLRRPNIYPNCYIRSYVYCSEEAGQRHRTTTTPLKSNQYITSLKLIKIKISQLGNKKVYLEGIILSILIT